MKRLTANTRTVVRSNYALVTEDSYVGSAIPGWEGAEVRVVISPAMGANLSQYLIRLQSRSRLYQNTRDNQLFFYVIGGDCKVKAGGQEKTLSKGGYIYIPAGTAYEIVDGAAELVAFQKTYVPLEGHSVPPVIWGDANQLEKKPYLDDPQLHMQYLLPDNLSMDFAVNIFTYNPGGNLPFVETHVMEHGLLYLQGEGIYRLDDDWYHVTKGDVIWMAPYCPQWFTAMGKQDAVYIYCKDVNRAV